MMEERDPETEDISRDESDSSDASILPPLPVKRPGSKEDLLAGERLSLDKSAETVHQRAKNLKLHYIEVAACDKIMAYGFITIMFLLTGFYWFIMLFSEEIKEQLQDYKLLAPAFVYGTLTLGVLNYFMK